MLDHAIKNCKILVQKGYELVMITNQGGIAKQMYTEADLKEMHQILLDEYAIQGIPFLATYYCPHHSIIENCLCRKPKGLMIERAFGQVQRQSKPMLFDRGQPKGCSSCTCSWCYECL